MDRPDFESLALAVRKQLRPGISPLEPVPLAHLIRGVQIGPLAVIARGHSGLDDDAYAVTMIDLVDASACIWLHREAWAELPREIPRTRFTVAHELAHCVLHAEDLDGLDVRPEGDHHAQLEAEANTFAAHLLIPDAALKRLGLTPSTATSDVLAKRFGVSARMAQRRLEEWRATR